MACEMRGTEQDCGISGHEGDQVFHSRKGGLYHTSNAAKRSLQQAQTGEVHIFCFLSLFSVSGISELMEESIGDIMIGHVRLGQPSSNSSRKSRSLTLRFAIDFAK